MCRRVCVCVAVEGGEMAKEEECDSDAEDEEEHPKESLLQP